MPVVIETGRARIEGTARVEEAETLVSFLESGADPVIDLGQAGHLHRAALQVLLAYRPVFSALPADPTLLALLTHMHAANTLEPPSAPQALIIESPP